MSRLPLVLQLLAPYNRKVAELEKLRGEVRDMEARLLPQLLTHSEGMTADDIGGLWRAIEADTDLKYRFWHARIKPLRSATHQSAE